MISWAYHSRRSIVAARLVAAPFVAAPFAALTIMLAVSAWGDETARPESVLVDGQRRLLPDVEAISEDRIRESIDRGVQFLLTDQHADGSWGSATATKGLNIYAPVPGAHHAFRTATTSLAISALIEVGDGQPAVNTAINLGEKWLLQHLGKLRRADGMAIYNVWGHAYAIEALVRLSKYRSEDPSKLPAIKDSIQQQIDMLDRYASVDGGWGYYDFRVQARQPTSDSISFVNGTVLIALADARDNGFEVPEPMIQKAIRATQRQKKSDFSYLYGEYLKNSPVAGINRPGGSLGRSQCCNAALRLWGDESVTDDVLKTWLYRLYVRNGWLDIGRKRPIPHESWMQVAGYFYYFGHYYGARCIDLLPTDQRDQYQTMLAHLMLQRQETNGCWWDYPLYDYHRPYGTGFALMTLHRCLP